MNFTYWSLHPFFYFSINLSSYLNRHHSTYLSVRLICLSIHQYISTKEMVWNGLNIKGQSWLTDGGTENIIYIKGTISEMERKNENRTKNKVGVGRLHAMASYRVECAYPSPFPSPPSILIPSTQLLECACPLLFPPFSSLPLPSVSFPVLSSFSFC